MGQINLSFILLSIIAGGFIGLLALRLVTLINVARDKEKNALLTLSTLMLGSSLWLLQVIHHLGFPLVEKAGFSLTISLFSWFFALCMAFACLFCASQTFLQKHWLMLGGALAGVCGELLFYFNVLAMQIRPDTTFSALVAVFVFPVSLIAMGYGVYFLYHFKFNAHLYRFRQKLIIALFIALAMLANHWLLDRTIRISVKANSLYPIYDDSLLVGIKLALGFTCLFFMPFVIAIFYDKFRFNTFLWRHLSQTTPENLYQHHVPKHLVNKNNLEEAKHQLDQALLSEELLEIFSYDALVLEYQLKVDSKSHRPTGAEAFLRWAHPQKGLLHPQDFMPLAEKLDMRDDIDAWVIEESCRMLHRLKSAGIFLPLSVNLSEQQLQQPLLIAHIQELLHRFDLDASQMIMDIPESVAFKNIEAFNKVLLAFKAANIQTAIDDFGTQFSTLAQLQHLDVTELKLGPDLTSDIEHNEKTHSVTKAMIDLAHALGLKVVAESVETEGQRQALVALNCDQMQGFIISPPLSEHRFFKLLNNLLPL